MRDRNGQDSFRKPVRRYILRNSPSLKGPAVPAVPSALLSPVKTHSTSFQCDREFINRASILRECKLQAHLLPTSRQPNSCRLNTLHPNTLLVWMSLRPGPNYLHDASTLSAHISPLYTLHLSHLPLRAPKPINALLLILPQPRFLRLSQNSLTQVINEMTNHDQDERNRIHPVYPQMEDFDTNYHAPEIPCQKRDILERRAGEAVQNGNECVENSQNERVPNEVATDFPVPGRSGEGVTVENRCLHAVDDHRPKTKLANDFVEGSAADEPLFVDVAETVEAGAEDGEEIAFQLLAACDAADGGAVDRVGPEKHAHAADADEYTEDLRPVVADLEEEKGEEDDDDDGPEVD